MTMVLVMGTKVAVNAIVFKMSELLHYSFLTSVCQDLKLLSVA